MTLHWQCLVKYILKVSHFQSNDYFGTTKLHVKQLLDLNLIKSALYHHTALAYCISSAL